MTNIFEMGCNHQLETDETEKYTTRWWWFQLILKFSFEVGILAGGFKYFLIFTPYIREDEAILTIFAIGLKPLRQIGIKLAGWKIPTQCSKVIYLQDEG